MQVVFYSDTGGHPTLSLYLGGGGIIPRLGEHPTLLAHAPINAHPGPPNRRPNKRPLDHCKAQSHTNRVSCPISPPVRRKACSTDSPGLAFNRVGEGVYRLWQNHHLTEWPSVSHLFSLFSFFFHRATVDYKPSDRDNGPQLRTPAFFTQGRGFICCKVRAQPAGTPHSILIWCFFYFVDPPEVPPVL